MKNLTLLLLTVLVSGWSVTASENSNQATRPNTNYNDSFIFVEGGVEFAVYPNGEFDFYYNPAFRRGSSVSINTPNMNISYNSGYNYDPFIQYDDYGAVIQVEDVPIYYDYYGRIVQAGNVVMNYNNFGMLATVGNLIIHYNSHQHFTHYSGYINRYNRRYVYRPWHDYYRRPSVNVSIVFNRPYRAYYQPRRVSYAQYTTIYNNYYAGHPGRRSFYRPAQKVKTYHYGDRVATKRSVRPANRSNYTTQKSRSRVADRNVYQNTRSGNTTVNRGRNDSYTERNQQSRSTQGNRRSDSKVYSGSAERSTNSRGRSSSEATRNERKVIRSRETSASPKRTTEARRNPAQRNTQTQSRTRSTNKVQRATRTPERKGNVQRQRTQQSSANRTQNRASRSTGRTQQVQRSTQQKSSSGTPSRSGRSGSSRGRSNG